MKEQDDLLVEAETLLEDAILSDLLNLEHGKSFIRTMAYIYTRWKTESIDKEAQEGGRPKIEIWERSPSLLFSYQFSCSDSKYA